MASTQEKASNFSACFGRLGDLQDLSNISSVNMETFCNVVLRQQTKSSSVYSACKNASKSYSVTSCSAKNKQDDQHDQDDQATQGPQQDEHGSNPALHTCRCATSFEGSDKVGQVHQACLSSCSKSCSGCFALKVFDTRMWTAAMLHNEVSIMKALPSHNNIVKFFESYENVSSKTAVIVQEYASRGDMLEHLIKHHSFPLNLARFYFDQLVDAVGCMHSCCVAHRDIKADNVVFDLSWTLKVCDFGTAVSWPSSMSSPVCTRAIGTVSNRAPEMQKMNFSHITDAFTVVEVGASGTAHAKGYDPKATDAWACAVLMFVMCFACPPFEDTAASKCRYFACLVQKDYNAFWNAHLCNFKACNSNSSSINNSNSNHIGHIGVLQRAELQGLFETLFEIDPSKRMKLAAMKSAVDAITDALCNDSDSVLCQAQVFDLMTKRTQVRKAIQTDK